MTNHIAQEYSEISTRTLQQVLNHVEAISFYKNVVRNIDAGHDYSGDVAVFKKVGNQAAKEVALEAVAEHEDKLSYVWDLPEVMRDAVELTMKSTMDARELIPRYDVQYVFATAVGKLTVHVLTKHVNSTVTVKIDAPKRDHAAAIAEAEQWLSTYWLMREVAA